MPGYARRVDGPHAEIVKVLRQLGWRVFDTSRVGDGFPDLVIHRIDRGLRLVEVKAPKARLRKKQADFALEFPTWIVRSVDDALKIR